MKLKHLLIRDFQGVEKINVELDAPVLVISGPNASGKTSVQNAIQFALDGSSGRVHRKMDYTKFLVREGAPKKKDAMVSVQLDDTVYQRSVQTGQVIGDEELDFPALLPYLLGTVHLRDLEFKDRARIITQVGGVSVNREKVEAMMVEDGADPAMVKEILVYLRGGFDAAQNKAKSNVSELRGQWQGITDERYGSTKAKDWKPDISDAPVRKAELEVKVKAAEKQRAAYVAQKAMLEEEEGDKGTPRHGMDCGPCPKCQTPLRYHQGTLYVLDGSEKTPEPNATDDVYSLERMIRAKDQEIGGLAEQRMRVDQDVADAVNKSRKAKKIAEDIEKWQKVVDLLAPDGVRARLLSEGLTPIRERLTLTCQRTGWPLIEIRDDLTQWYAGRPYDLVSESERWKVDVATAEALAFVSGIKFVVFDRMDVLGPPARGPFIKWLMYLAQELDTVIVLATLKSEPPVPPGFASLWLGEKEAA